MFKVNNKTPEHLTTGVILVSLLLTLNMFTSCSSVSLVNFEDVIAGCIVGTFLELMLLISFSISPISAIWNEKISRFSKCFYMKRILAWNFYLSLALSIGSVISSDFILVMKLFSLIFNVDTSFLKNSFSSFAIRSSSCNTSSISTSLICHP